ncbi:hypothetical protein B7991_02495 [Fibrobacter sp. UWB3]|nr:hypothetical protein B7991_02495 [Fibrobacter sp. UWB3]
MATVALLGSTAAWAVDCVSASGSTLTLQSNASCNKVSIADGVSSGINKIVVERGTESALYSTLMLPVTVKPSESENILAAYYPTGYNPSTTTLDMQSTDEIKANKPYLVEVLGSPKTFTFNKASGYTVEKTGDDEHSVTLEKSCWEFTGTYAYKHWDSADNLYGYDSEDGVFVKALSATIYPMRAYLTCTGSGYSNNSLRKSAVEELPEVINVRFLDKNGGTLSIGKMNTRTGDIQMQDRYYDLKGRKLNGKPQNKIMYVNKKVIKH